MAVADRISVSSSIIFVFVAAAGSMKPISVFSSIFDSLAFASGSHVERISLTADDVFAVLVLMSFNVSCIS